MFKALALSFVICTTAMVLPTQSLAAEAEATTNEQQSFAQWLKQFELKAQASGISADTLRIAFDKLEPDPSIIRSDQSQPEHSRAVWQYLEGSISSWRVARGKSLLAEHRRALDEIEKQFKVDRHILVAIWGLESNFGQNMGDKNIIRSLATLAHHGRRADFWETQLIAALKILENGDISRDKLVGSWAGAMGQTQFIPTTYLSYAVDFNKDGRRDIWNSAQDALASAANYLAQSGWQPEQHWGYEVTLPTLFEHASADGTTQKTVAQWLKIGVTPKSNKEFSAEELSLPASIFLPSGYRGPAYLQLDNFRSIMKYNNSTSYGLAVGLLADSLAGGIFSLHRWPKEDIPLTRTERIELQTLLNELNLSSGEPDGIVGANTRKAIRKFQHENDLPADGYASERLLEQIRKQAALKAAQEN